MGFIGLIKNAFALVTAWMTGSQRTEDKKSGGQEVELTQIKKGMEAQKDAKKVRADKPKRSRRDHLKRM